MKNFLYLFLLISTAVMFNSCDDDNSNENTTIEIMSPTELQVYKPGDMIFVKYHLYDKAGIYQYNVEIYTDEQVDSDFEVKKEYGFDVLINEFTESFSSLIPLKGRNARPLSDAVYNVKFTVLNNNNVITTYVRKFKIETPQE